MDAFTQQEIEALYEQNFERIYKFFYYKFLSRSIAEDLTSEAFLLFVKSVREHRKIENSNKFLWGIVRHLYLRYLTQKYKEPIHVGDDIDKFMEKSEDCQKDYSPEERILPFINKLPHAQRQVIYMRLIDKKPLQQIAEEISKNMNYVKTTQKRAIASLKKAVACTP